MDRLWPASRRRLAAYTLVEVVLATAVLAIVLLGAQSAVVIASRALPTGTAGPSAAAAAGGALGTLADDVAVATSLTTLAASDLQFTVPDRNGDGNDDTIRYVWSGTPGAPLQRRVNGGEAATIIPAVQDFTLTYDRTQAALPQTYSEGAEQVLFTRAASGISGTVTVQDARWYAQYFQPVISAPAKWWSITRITYRAVRNSGNEGLAKAELRRDLGGQPVSNVLGQELMLENDLDSAWTTAQADYSIVSGLRPGDGLWLVFEWVYDTEAFDVQTRTAVTGATPFKKSTNSGASWNTVSNTELVCTVYGKIALPDAPQYQYVLAGVGCRLRTGAAAGSGVAATFQVLNRPVVPGP